MLVNLEKLILSSSKVEILPDSLGRLKKLKHLDLSSCKIIALPNSICNLSALKYLYLGKTNIEELPNMIGSLKALERISLFKTSIKSLPESFCELTNLERLNIKHTYIKQLPENLQGFKKLHELNLCNTKISTLPDSIGALKNLCILDLSYSSICTIPNTIGNLNNLTSLELHDTNIEELPESVCNLNQLRVLSIYNTKIKILPNCIDELKNIKILNLSNTQIRELPDAFYRLVGLERLIINNTGLESLSEKIENLSSLKLLYIANTDICKLPDSIGKLQMLETFELVNTKVAVLPESIGDLRNLNTLTVSSSGVNTLPITIGQLSQLVALDLSSTMLKELPDVIEGLSNLEKLNLHNTQIDKLPDSICSLTKLKLLDIGLSKVTTLPREIGKLSSLEILNMNYCKILSLPESMGDLGNLSAIDMSKTEFDTITFSFEKMTNLQRLNLASSKIKRLPDSIKYLTNLTELYLGSSRIEELTGSIGNLSKLPRLDLSNTKLTDLPSSIGNLTNLNYLNLSGTNIAILPDTIGNLLNLRSLCLSMSMIDTFPVSIKSLSQLNTIDLTDCKISSISEDIGDYSSVKILVLQGLILDKLPASILKLGLPFINSKYKSLSNNSSGIYIDRLMLRTQPISLFYQERRLIEQYYKEEQTAINEAKVIFLGDGGVGKTYSIKRLLNNGKKESSSDTYKTKTTHGILIKPYHLESNGQKFEIKFWDFGGQQIMHSMHRCFLTERTCYVIMLSTRTDRNITEQARYWLKTVFSFTHNSPIIIMVNQWNDTLQKVDETRLCTEFKNISKFLYFSAVEAEDLEFGTLLESIISQIKLLDSYRLYFPTSWYGLKKDLEQEALSEHFYISKREYYTLCYNHNISYENEDIYDWLLDWFNDLGVCFSYHKNSNSKKLDKYMLLAPEWLTRATYNLINKGCNESDNGILSYNSIEKLLTNTMPVEDIDQLGNISYSDKEIGFILEILRKFWISYPLPLDNELIPVLCDEKSTGRSTPVWFTISNPRHKRVSYEFEYDYLPEAVIHRLMIFCYQGHYYVQSRWRRGMSINYDAESDTHLTAIVDSGGERSAITIDVFTDGHIPAWLFLKKLRDEILEINFSMNLKAKDYIIMETNGIRDRFSVNAVLKCRARGNISFPATEYDGDYQISEILGSAYGVNNSAIIEAVVTEPGSAITAEQLGSLFDNVSRIEKGIEDINNTYSALLREQFKLRLETSNALARILVDQESSTALLESIIQAQNKPDLLQKIRKNVLSKIAITADCATLISFANPDLAAKAPEIFNNILEALQVILTTTG